MRVPRERGETKIVNRKSSIETEQRADLYTSGDRTGSSERCPDGHDGGSRVFGSSDLVYS